jgi:hypothetical protein
MRCREELDSSGDGFWLLAKEGQKDAINCDAARVDGQMLKNRVVEAQAGTGRHRHRHRYRYTPVL